MPQGLRKRIFWLQISDPGPGTINTLNSNNQLPKLSQENNFIIVFIIWQILNQCITVEKFLYHFWLIYGQHYFRPHLDIDSIVLVINNNYPLPPHQKVSSVRVFHSMIFTCFEVDTHKNVFINNSMDKLNKFTEKKTSPKPGNAQI